MFKANIGLGIVLVLFISASHAFLPPKIWRCREANLKPGAKLQGCDFSLVNFKNLAAGRPGGFVDLTGANISGADFTGNAHVEKVIFNNVIGEGAKFNEARISQSIFRQANLQKVEFKKAVITSVDFSGAIISGSTFANAQIGTSKFENARVYKVNFSHVTFRSSVFNSIASISNSNLDNAIFSNLTSSTFDGTLIKFSSLTKTTFTCKDNLLYPMFQSLFKLDNKNRLLLNTIMSCNLDDIDFSQRNLRYWIFTKSSFSRSDFTGADISKGLCKNNFYI